MVTSFDREYKATKRIRQGKVSLEPPFAELANWIASRWQVTVLNVIYDHFIIGHKKQPRLQVILEHSRDCGHFFDGPNFDHVKQEAIAARFNELMSAKSNGHDHEKAFVAFSAPVA